MNHLRMPDDSDYDYDGGMDERDRKLKMMVPTLYQRTMEDPAFKLRYTAVLGASDRGPGGKLVIFFTREPLGRSSLHPEPFQWVIRQQDMASI